MSIEEEPKTESREKVTVDARLDGFGSQFQHYIWAAIYADAINADFYMPEITTIAHNYDNSPRFVDLLKDTMSLYDIFPSIREVEDKSSIRILQMWEYCVFVENNLEKCLSSKTMERIKCAFWRKNTDFIDAYFNTEHRAKTLTIGIHIRRNNRCDDRVVDANGSKMEPYVKQLQETLGKQPKDRDIDIHIVTQAPFAEVRENFVSFLNTELANTRKTRVILHEPHSTKFPFLCLAACDILMISFSSFSYCAALLSNSREVYYVPFWHNARPGWRPLDVPKQHLAGYSYGK